MAYKKFLTKACGNFKKAVKVLQERFDPESHRDLYLAEFQTQRKAKTKSWPEFGEDLQSLVDKAYRTLDDDAQQQLALQRYLSQLDNDQVAFSVKQWKPRTNEAAVGVTLEYESYLIRPNQSAIVVAPVQSESRDSVLLDMMTQLMIRMDKLEANVKLKTNSTVRKPSEQEIKPRVVVCYQHGQEGYFAWGCAQSKRSKNQDN